MNTALSFIDFFLYSSASERVIVPSTSFEIIVRISTRSFERAEFAPALRIASVIHVSNTNLRLRYGGLTRMSERVKKSRSRVGLELEPEPNREVRTYVGPPHQI